MSYRRQLGLCWCWFPWGPSGPRLLHVASDRHVVATVQLCVNKAAEQRPGLHLSLLPGPEFCVIIISPKIQNFTCQHCPFSPLYSSPKWLQLTDSQIHVTYNYVKRESRGQVPTRISPKDQKTEIWRPKRIESNVGDLFVIFLMVTSICLSYNLLRSSVLSNIKMSSFSVEDRDPDFTFRNTVII